VDLFVRLGDNGGSGSTGWNDGFAMNPQGAGMFLLNLLSSRIPGYNSYLSATLEYQFAATDKNGDVVLRSPVYRDIQLTQCTKK
jgi:hypothetical protein